MSHDELIKKYFDWMYRIVFGDRRYTRLSYRRLLIFLFNTEYYPIIGEDENRLQDGLDFRYRFGYEYGYSRDIIKTYIDNRPCSVLEMMVALAFKGEEQIMDDPDYGDRTGQWFWNMIVSLGLGSMSDSHFDEKYAASVVDRFLNRNYAPNGSGGLFTIDDCAYDLRDIEVWTQFMWYLNQIIEQSE